MFDHNICAIINMPQRKGMNIIKKTLLLFTFLNIVIPHSLPMNNNTQTPSSRPF